MTESTQKKWLQKNQGAIAWRLVGPNFKNRFDASVSEAKLEEYCSDRSALMEACAVHGVMDETLLIKVTDLTNLRYVTEHPYVHNIEATELKSFLDEAGVWDKISEDFLELQKRCAQELEDRRGSSGGY